MKYKCRKEMCLPRCDGDGFEIPNEYEFVKVGSIWERYDRRNLIGGDVHLDSLDDDSDFGWIEMSFEELRENFVLVSGMEEYGIMSDEKYTIEQIADAIVQSDMEIIQAIQKKDREMLENALKEYLLDNITKQNQKKRIYISGPITGTDNYEEKFKSAENKLKEKGFETVNPVFVAKSLPEWMENEGYLAADLCMLNMCNSIYLLKGWEQSKGANREYGYALAKGMQIIFES